MKMTKRKLVSSAPKTITKWSPSRPLTATLATGAVVSTSSEKEKSLTHGLKDSSDSPYQLKVIGRKILVEEEPIEITPDVGTGLTEDVVKMISGGKLVIPDVNKYALEKFPYKGTILSCGEKCRYYKVGDRVHFARGGVQRFQFAGKQFLVMHEEDVHGKYETIS